MFYQIDKMPKEEKVFRFIKDKWDYFTRSIQPKGLGIPMIIERTSRGERAWDPFSYLLQNRIVLLTGPINDDVAGIIISQFLILESDSGDEKKEKDIHFYINSQGGVVTAGMAIYDTMQFVQDVMPIRTICMGQAASMGAVLLASGTKGKRTALPHGRIMIHQPIGGVTGQADDMSILLEEIMRLKELTIGILAKNCGRDRDKVRQDMERDNFMSAEEAKAYGLIDSIFHRRQLKKEVS